METGSLTGIKGFQNRRWASACAEANKGFFKAILQARHCLAASNPECGKAFKKALAANEKLDMYFLMNREANQLLFKGHSPIMKEMLVNREHKADYAESNF